MVTVVNDGLEYLARYINQSTAGAFICIATGSGSTAEGAAQTALVTENTTETGLDRDSSPTTTVGYEASYKSTWTKVFTATDTVTVRECGIFNSTTVAGSKMLMRHLFGADKPMVATDTLTLTFKLTIAT